MLLVCYLFCRSRGCLRRGGFVSGDLGFVKGQAFSVCLVRCFFVPSLSKV